MREWTPEETDLIITSYRGRYPGEWQAYIAAENDDGFISNAMNDHICSHIEELFPGLKRMHYRAGAVDFRFANERRFHFAMWQPENRHRRREKWLEFIKTRSQQQNGNSEWTESDSVKLLVHLQNNDPSLWNTYFDCYNNIGFIGPGTASRIAEHVGAIFPVPEDCGHIGLMFGMLEEANHRYAFEMFKPKNAKLLNQLENEWLNEIRGHTTFEEWSQIVIERSKKVIL